MGEGRHARFCVVSGGVRARAVAFGCGGRLRGDQTLPRDATFKLERSAYNGAVEPRLVLRHEQPCAPPPIEVLGEPGDYMATVLSELERPLAAARTTVARAPSPHPPARRVIDRRGESPLAVLGDAVAAGGPVLAVCADVPRRLDGLASTQRRLCAHLP